MQQQCLISRNRSKITFTDQIQVDLAVESVDNQEHQIYHPKEVWCLAFHKKVVKETAYFQINRIILLNNFLRL